MSMIQKESSTLYNGKEKCIVSQTVVAVFAVSVSIVSALIIIAYCAINSADHDNEELWNHKHKKQDKH